MQVDAPPPVRAASVPDYTGKRVKRGRPHLRCKAFKTYAKAHFNANVGAALEAVLAQDNVPECVHAPLSTCVYR